MHFNVHLEDDRLSCLVIIGVRVDGVKEVIAIDDGYRESTESWLTLLRDLKARDMKAPKRQWLMARRAFCPTCLNHQILLSVSLRRPPFNMADPQHLTIFSVWTESFNIVAVTETPERELTVNPTTIGPLDSGEQASFDVILTVPSGLMEAEEIAVTISVACQGGPGVTAAVLDKIMVEVFNVYVPLVVNNTP